MLGHNIIGTHCCNIVTIVGYIVKSRSDTDPASEQLGGLDPTEKPRLYRGKILQRGKKRGKEMHVQKISIILIISVLYAFSYRFASFLHTLA